MQHKIQLDTDTSLSIESGGIAYPDIPRLRAQISVFLDKQHMPSAYADRYRLALSEILTNLIKHPKEKAKKITVTMMASDGYITMTVADDSTPFASFDAKCKSARDRLAAGVTFCESGYGLGCILSQHTTVCYTSENGINTFSVSDKPLEKSVVFIIDDDPVTLRSEHQKLSSHYDVVPLQNGAAALALFMRQRPDLIISDIVMPGMDGMELRRRISALDGGNTVPFIFLSAQKDKEHSRDIATLGIDDFLCKPVKADRLLAVADRLITRSKQLKKGIERRFHTDLDARLRPELPARYGQWRIATRNLMAESGGGDFALYHEKQNSMMVVLADVMGHGTEAKFFSYAYAGYLRSLFRLSFDDHDPAAFLRNLSQAVEGDAFLDSIIMTCMGFDLFPDGRIAIAAAGHPPPFLTGDGSVTTLHVSGPLPGLSPQNTYPLTETRLNHGQKIIFATDGFFEHVDSADIAAANSASSAEDAADTLWNIFSDKKHETEDDATLVVATFGELS